MNLIWLYLFNAVLLTRLPLIWKDQPVKVAEAVIASLLQAATLAVFVLNSSFYFIIGGFLGINLFQSFAERDISKENLPTLRLLTLFLFAVLISIASSESFRLSFQPELVNSPSSLGGFFSPLLAASKVDWKSFHACLFGILLCIGEANLVVRTFVGSINLRQSSTDRELITPRNNTGRVIGLLERLTLFTLVLLGQYTALGFVIAAKTMARFKALEERNFAEYFLIGTLVSLISAGAIALMTIYLIKG